MKKILLALMAVMMCTVMGCGEGTKDFTPDPQAWSSEFNIPISKTLVKNSIRGCGQMRWQPVPQWSSEFIVQCAPNGEYNVEYQVFTAVEKVEGPFRPGGKY